MPFSCASCVADTSLHGEEIISFNKVKALRLSVGSTSHAPFLLLAYETPKSRGESWPQTIKTKQTLSSPALT